MKQNKLFTTGTLKVLYKLVNCYDAFQMLLEPKCLWCNYNGEDYWKSGSHKT